MDATGLNRQQFATALGITWGNADGIYRGRQCPSVLTLARIAGVVGCKPAELLEGVEPVPPAPDPAELLKAAEGNGRRGRKASQDEGQKPKASPKKAPRKKAAKGKAATKKAGTAKTKRTPRKKSAGRKSAGQ